MRIGLISDTHGLLRPEAVDALHGSDRIVHAGDIGEPSVLAALQRLAPLTAVRGNNDRGAWADSLADWTELTVDGLRIGVVHDRGDLARYDKSGLAAIVCGHSHIARIEELDGRLIVNPGSAGPRRFRRPVTVGELVVEGSSVRARIVTLDVPTANARRR